MVFSAAFVVWPAAAEIPLVEGGETQLQFGAYASSFNMFSRLDYDLPAPAADETATGAALLRLEWSAQVGANWALDVHNRLFYSSSSSGLAAGAFGLGSSVAPERSLSLESALLDSDNAKLVHDLDRFALTYFSALGDLTLGRQAITWGVSQLFIVSELWTQFSPFELDTSQKRGIDAVRLLSYPGAGFELDAVVADRGGLDEGSARDLSGGIKLGFSGGVGDYYLGAAKSYQRVMVVIGTNQDLDAVSARVDATLAYDFDDEQLQPPRATLGVDYLSERLSITGEYHYSGEGTIDQDQYAQQLVLDPEPELRRGERYFVGQHYLGLMTSYAPWVELRLSTLLISNLLDPSALVAPALSYDFSASVSGTLGAYIGLGETPQVNLGLPPLIEVPSEFGLVGQSYFLQLSGFI